MYEKKLIKNRYAASFLFKTTKQLTSDMRSHCSWHSVARVVVDRNSATLGTIPAIMFGENKTKQKKTPRKM